MIESAHINEVYEPDGEARGFYRPLLEILGQMGPEDFAGRRARARVLLKDLGATFPLPGESDDRVLPADWMPRIIPKDHWQKLSAGLLQRGKAINAWISDLYNGGQFVVPDEIIKSSVFYRKDQLPESAIPVHVYGPDVIHLESGEYAVLEDNVRVPSGVAYSEAVRKAARAAFENTFEPYRVTRIAPYYALLRATLQAAAPPDVEVSTSSTTNPTPTWTCALTSTPIP